MQEPSQEPAGRREKAAGEKVPAHNMPFGHAMTRRAQDVTVPVHAAHKTQEEPENRSIPVEGQPETDETAA